MAAFYSGAFWSGAFWTDTGGSSVASLVVTPSGGIALAGTTARATGRAYLSAGGLTTSGAASVVRTLTGVSRIVAATGGMVLSGISGILRGRVKIPNGGIVFGGSVQNTSSGGETGGETDPPTTTIKAHKRSRRPRPRV